MYFCGNISETVTHLSAQAADGFFCVGHGNRVAAREAKEMSVFLGVTVPNAPWKLGFKGHWKSDVQGKPGKREVGSHAES